MKAFRGSLALVALVIASCSLPANQAWRVIQRDGLIPYIAMERGVRPFPSKDVLNTPLVARSSYFDYPWTPGYSVAQRSSQQRVLIPYRSSTAPMATPKPAPVAPSTQNLASVAQQRTVTAPTKKYTPARSSAAPKPAPRYTPNRPTSNVAANKPAIINTPVAKITNETAGIPRQDSFVSEPKTKMTPPASAATSTPQSTPNAVVTTTPPPTVMKPASSLPYGKGIPNRPGMVNSPYAANHQIVDVTGLKPGQEVKCPFTGKLFRVPGSEQASNKPKVPEISTPDNAPKKP